MKTKHLLVALVLAASGPAIADDLVKTAERSPEIRTFVDAINLAGLNETFRNKGPFTIFAPSESAMARLSPDVKKTLLSNKENATKFVSDHIVPGKIVVTEIKPGKTQTIDGRTISLQSDNGLVKVEGASVIQSDIVADNGVIHIVDTVVLPEK